MFEWVGGCLGGHSTTGKAIQWRKLLATSMKALLDVQRAALDGKRDMQPNA
jgi:hypothetical protein